MYRLLLSLLLSSTSMLLLIMVDRCSCKKDTHFFYLNNNNTYSFNKFTIEHLLNNIYPHKISNDIDLDPCKSNLFLNDIALPNIDYDKELKEQNFKIFNQDLLIEDKNLLLGNQYHTNNENSTKHSSNKFSDQEILNRYQRDNDKIKRKTRSSNTPKKHHNDDLKNENFQENDLKNKSKKLNRGRRAATARQERIWDYGVIPYEIDANFSGSHKALFKQAMRHWENVTCVKFVERDIQEHPNYIIFTERPCGCCSFVGKRGNGPQAISLGKDCDKFGIVVHELGHVVGFWHEHTRPDRDNHVQIIRDNIMRGQDNNFNKLSNTEVNSLGVPYDYNSIMHYSRNTFSKGIYLDTIQPLIFGSNNKLAEIGQRVRLSELDILQTNLLYKCYKCGRTFQENFGNFSSPGYPNINSQINEQCEWRITGTNGERIILNITDIDILETENCTTDYIEIRDGYWHKSPILGRFCGNNNGNLIVSSSSRMLISYVTTKQEQKIFRGFAINYEAVCGGDIYIENNTGHLESPNYPEDYQDNKLCIWRLSVPDNYQIVLKFQSFDIENHDNCTYDYVEIRDGHLLNSTLIGRFCGYHLPEDIRSNSSQLLVKFVSDNSLQKRGFSAKFMKESDECAKQNHGCQHKCINTLEDYQCACFIGYELSSDGKSCENTCGGILNTINGTITSPSFPELYLPNTNCIWEIRAPLLHKIILNFTHFDLEGYMGDCDSDSLKVQSVFNDNTYHKHGIYCGSFLPSIFISKSNTLRLHFTTDDTIQKSGFAAIFLTDIDECEVNNGGCEDECINTIGSYHCRCNNGFIVDDNGHGCKVGNCRFEITSPIGNITSPDYPNYYPSDQDCYWHFITTPGHRIYIVFIDFDLEPHQECFYDHVIFYDGNTTDDWIVDKFCGSKMPYPILSSSNQLFLNFKSFSFSKKKGFRAIHSTACGGRLQVTNQTEYFYSHSLYGDKDYSNRADCYWEMEAPRGRTIHLIFQQFDLEEQSECDYDYVEIYGGLDLSASSFGKFCGNSIPKEFDSFDETLMVRFHTDNSVTAKGFAVSYTYVAEKIDSNINYKDENEAQDYDEYML